MGRPAPFEFKDCALITLSVGKSVQNLRELRDRLGEAPAQSIWHHFFESLLRPTYDDPEYPNDFAQWAKRGLHDDVLAERLGVIEPLEYEDVEALRQHLLDVVEDRLAEVGPIQAASHELYLLRSQMVVFSTGLRAATPQELGLRIQTAPTGSVFFHFYDGRRRSPDKRDDFSTWLSAWGTPCAAALERLAFARLHHGSLIEMRGRIAGCFRAGELEEVGR